MTTIAAVRTSTSWLLACDTAAASNDGRIWPVRTKLQVLGHGGPTYGHAIVGSSGYRLVQPAIAALGAPALRVGARVTEIELDSAVQAWVEELSAELRERHVPTCDDGQIDGMQLLAWRGGLWMCTDGLAERIDAAHTAVGSGGDLALGYLDAALGHLAEPHYAAEDALREAIRCAVRHDSGCGGDVDMVALEDKGRFERVE